MSKYKHILEQDRKKRKTLAVTNQLNVLNQVEILHKCCKRSSQSLKAEDKYWVLSYIAHH